MTLWLYRFVQIILSPLIAVLLLYRLSVGREDPIRFAERWGRSSIPRPEGTLVWFHGASVGEITSLVPVLRHLRALQPNLSILITTGTRNGMKTAQRHASAIGGTVMCQYVPLDIASAVKRFMGHWKPTLSIFVESEFWPELTHAAPHPILLNGRISDRSWPRYQTWGWFFNSIISRYDLIIAQRNVDAERLRHLGAKYVTVGGNLKFDADALFVDDVTLDKFRAVIGNRPTIVVASTHPGEEVQAAQIHTMVKEKVPNVLTVIVPRHPHRGTAATNEIVRITRNVRRRGTGEMPALGGPRHTDIFVADTLGELGLWYRLADIAVIGGSLVPHGGHNPLEPLRLGVPTATGPHMFNFQDMLPPLLENGLVKVCSDRQTLAQYLIHMLTNREAVQAMRTLITSYLPLLSGSSKTAALAINERLPVA